MGRQIYAEISTDNALIYTPGKGKNDMWETIRVPLPPGLFGIPGMESNIISSLNLPRYKSSNLVLVANMRKTVIRVATVPPRKGNKPIKPAAQWELVRSAFPLGEKMNEKTYVFDGCEFTNGKGDTCFFMVALPMDISGIIAQIGEAIAGSSYRLSRIDTVEHVLLKKYISQSTKETLTFAKDGEVLILLPQDGGLRILHITAGLPQTTCYISNHPSYRTNELTRYMQALQKHGGHRIDNAQIQHGSVHVSSESKHTAPLNAVFLYSEPEHISKWQWLHDNFQKMGVSIDSEPFSLYLP